MRRRYLYGALLISGSGLFLTGCEDSAKVAAHRLDEALTTSETISDPRKAYSYLSAQYALIDSDFTESRGLLTQPPVDTVQRYKQHMAGLVLKTVERYSDGQSGGFKTPDGRAALAWLFSVDTEGVRKTEIDQLRQQYAKELVEVALSSPGTAQDVPLLDVAAHVLVEGRYVSSDYVQAIGLKARAWAAGSNAAPGAIAGLFSRLGDDRSAYMWALRCHEGCYGNMFGGTLASSYEESVNKSEIPAIQLAAQMPATVHYHPPTSLSRSRSKGE
jgi:hypothetical protein